MEHRGNVSRLGICVNPMAGRDVRRIAARASTVTHESKMDIAARIAAGADTVGIDEIVIFREPFRIAERALEWMPLKANVRLLDIDLDHSANDTFRAIEAFSKLGVDHVVALGGDGTHRTIAKTGIDLFLIPLSTGTNNVYPLTIEATHAGIVSGLGAKGEISPQQFSRQSKIAHLRINGEERDLALIDIGRIEGDFIGNYRPFKASRIRELVLTRALPDSIGMSPIGGLVDPVSEREDQGLYVRLGKGRRVMVPVSPGHFQPVEVNRTQRLDMGESISLQSEGVLELDGDRLYRIQADDLVEVQVRRDGPRVYDVSSSMHYVAQNHLI